MEKTDKSVEKNKDVRIALNEPINYDRLLDISTDELDFLKNEAESVITELKGKIVQEYERIKPSLNQMRAWKQQLKLLQEKREVYRTFLNLDRNDTLLSGNSSLGIQKEVKRVSFGELFSDLEKDEEGQPNSGKEYANWKVQLAKSPNSVGKSLAKKTPVKKSSLFTSIPRKTPNMVTLAKK